MQLAVAHLLALGDLLEQTALDRDTQHSGSLLSGGDVGVAEVHDVLSGDGLGRVLVQPRSEVLVLQTSLGDGGLARLGDAVEHLLQHLADLGVVEVGDGELEGGLAGDGGLGHEDLLSAGRSRGCGVRLFRSPSLTITIRSFAQPVNDFFPFTVHPHFPTVHRLEVAGYRLPTFSYRSPTILEFPWTFYARCGKIFRPQAAGISIITHKGI